MRLGTWERAASFASWVNGERALAAFRAGTAAEAPADLVYKQIELPPEELLRARVSLALRCRAVRASTTPTWIVRS